MIVFGAMRLDFSCYFRADFIWIRSLGSFVFLPCVFWCGFTFFNKISLVFVYFCVLTGACMCGLRVIIYVVFYTFCSCMLTYPPVSVRMHIYTSLIIFDPSLPSPIPCMTSREFSRPCIHKTHTYALTHILKYLFWLFSHSNTPLHTLRIPLHRSQTTITSVFVIWKIYKFMIFRPK